MSDYAVLLPT